MIRSEKVSILFLNVLVLRTGDRAPISDFNIVSRLVRLSLIKLTSSRTWHILKASCPNAKLHLMFQQNTSLTNERGNNTFRASCSNAVK